MQAKITLNSSIDLDVQKQKARHLFDRYDNSTACFAQRHQKLGQFSFFLQFSVTENRKISGPLVHPNGRHAKITPWWTPLHCACGLKENQKCKEEADILVLTHIYVSYITPSLLITSTENDTIYIVFNLLMQVGMHNLTRGKNSERTGLCRKIPVRNPSW